MLHIGIPRSVVSAIKALYKDVKHYVKVGDLVEYVFTAQTGVRQGCPLSPLLFIIATDAMIRVICSRIPSGDLNVRAFADDIGIVLRHFNRYK